MKHWFSFILFKTFTKSFYWWGVKILIFNYGNLFLGSYSGCRVLLPYPERESFIRTTLICGFPVEKLPQGVKVEPFPKSGWVVKFWSFEFWIFIIFEARIYIFLKCARFLCPKSLFPPFRGEKSVYKLKSVLKLLIWFTSSASLLIMKTYDFREKENFS